jgi:hypothetical protein
LARGGAVAEIDELLPVDDNDKELTWRCRLQAGFDRRAYSHIPWV